MSNVLDETKQQQVIALGEGEPHYPLGAPADNLVALALGAGVNRAPGEPGWRTVEIARGSSDRTCPVQALETWLKLGRIVDGPVFRPMTIANGGVQSQRLSDRHVARLVQKLALAAGVRGLRRGGV